MKCINIPEKTHAVLKELAKERQCYIGVMYNEAIDQYLKSHKKDTAIVPVPEKNMHACTTEFIPAKIIQNPQTARDLVQNFLETNFPEKTSFVIIKNILLKNNITTPVIHNSIWDWVIQKYKINILLAPGEKISKKKLYDLSYEG